MKILLTGATGYIAQRLLPVLLENGHQVVCCVRDISRFNHERYTNANLSIIEVNFLDQKTLSRIPRDIDAAYYLIHSMSTSVGDFAELEDVSARNFRSQIEQTNAEQVIYLSGITNNSQLSKHLTSRKNVEEILQSSKYALTTLKAGIIIGSGSASFEIIRDLVEKLPLIIGPRWLNTRSQPIAIRNVLQYMLGVLHNEPTYNKSYDIGGVKILTYKELLLRFAKVRGLKRIIWVLPVMTPRLSSYWLYFVTSTTYSLASNLVKSMKVEVICEKNNLNDLIGGIQLIGYSKAIQLAFGKIEQNQVVSSWKDALTSSVLLNGISQHIQVPKFGCFTDRRKYKIKTSPEQVMQNIWSIGGTRGWYHANWLWEIRGAMDRLTGGVGLRRGRKNPSEISAGESLDFWRVLLANKAEQRLLLYAEMKLPGEAWLEFKIVNNDEVIQTAIFRPLGIWGRIYWFSVLPFHGYIFKGMIKAISTKTYNH
jgi:uncharacterized protein YbjT (DUF2867 family)